MSTTVFAQQLLDTMLHVAQASLAHTTMSQKWSTGTHVLKTFYCQMQKTMNTWNISGPILIV